MQRRSPHSAGRAAGRAACSRSRGIQRRGSAAALPPGHALCTSTSRLPWMASAAGMTLVQWSCPPPPSPRPLSLSVSHPGPACLHAPAPAGCRGWLPRWA
eukprot:213452-Chlamydomonas_euryale.AAC.4